MAITFATANECFLQAARVGSEDEFLDALANGADFRIATRTRSDPSKMDRGHVEGKDTVLHLAAYYRKTHIVRLIKALDMGPITCELGQRLEKAGITSAAAANFRKEGDIPLHQIRNEQGKIPLIDAIKNNNHEVIVELASCDYPDLRQVLSAAMTRAIEVRSTEAMTILLDLAGRANAALDLQTHLVRCSYREDHEEEVKLLLKNGAKPVAQESPGSTTPLHQACARGLFNLVELYMSVIMQQDTSLLNVKDENGNTPLMRTIGSPTDTQKDNMRGEGRLAIVRLLKQNGADIYLKNNAGETAISRANGQYGATKKAFYWEIFGELRAGRHGFLAGLRGMFSRSTPSRGAQKPAKSSGQHPAPG